MDYFNVVWCLLYSCIVALTNAQSYDICYIDAISDLQACEYSCCGEEADNDRRCCESRSEKPSTWVIVVAVCGALFGLAVIILVVILCCRKARGKRDDVYRRGRATPMSSPSSRPQQTTAAWEDIPEDQHTVIRVGDTSNKAKHSGENSKGRKLSSTVSCIATPQGGSMVMNVQ